MRVESISVVWTGPEDPLLAVSLSILNGELYKDGRLVGRIVDARGGMSYGFIWDLATDGLVVLPIEADRLTVDILGTPTSGWCAMVINGMEFQFDDTDQRVGYDINLEKGVTVPIPLLAGAGVLALGAIVYAVRRK